MSGKRYINATFCSLICIYPGPLDDFASDFLSLRQTQTAPLFAPTMKHTLARGRVGSARVGGARRWLGEVGLCRQAARPRRAALDLVSCRLGGGKDAL